MSSVKCNHVKIVKFKSFCPHKGYSTEYECECCHKAMYWSKDNYFAYGESKDDLKREIVKVLD